ncbi:hypothetical protein H0H87_001771 [Tephrocybe sp. NHM501043]|nr:hypothetical protein H0H87_001771 [Tephrocybe sp. NHM501043]
MNNPSPGDILEMVRKKPPGITFNLPHDIFPTTQEIDKILDSLSPDCIHPSLAVAHSHIPPAAAFAGSSRTPQTFDKRGFSTYARIIDALLQVFAEDRQIARHNIWALRHFQAFELYAQDFISIPSAKSEVFAAEAIHASLEIMVSRVEQVTTYILTSSADEGWREAALTSALENRPSTSSGTLTSFLADTIQRSRTLDSPRENRILRNILQHIFRDVEKDEADRWMQLARKVEAVAPETSMAITWAVTNFSPEPPRLDRYRNELAASVLGITPAKANVEGLLTLRKLCASAPNPDSDVVFLPQPRAVNITKACQQWITSDEDVDEEVVSAITALFYHLAPILQDIPGAHWDLAFDILENNLEESSLADDTSLVTLARTLRLITLIQDLCLTNKSLRAEWEERNMSILKMVRDLATVSIDHLEPSIPRSTCRGLLLSIVQDLPPSLINETTFSKMCHLVTDPSVEVQKMAYRFLAIAARKRTEFLVIEAGVDTEGVVDIRISEDLLNILQRSPGIEDGGLESSNVFGYLLGWMLLFDLFRESVNLKVRSSYIEQLRNLDVVVAYFIPTILTLLHLDQGPHKAFKLDIWGVDEFYVDCYEAGSKFTLPILAAHLYYRALLTIPSLIHTWVTDCKDRQLSSGITNYTSQCFSPVIIRTELAHVKSPESSALLVDENFTIKVASSVNEVVASYSVDEHQLEIKLKIPTDWPLHKIEIKDLKRVGVDENRWRAWILAVQQIIWSHNGRIIDGLESSALWMAPCHESPAGLAKTGSMQDVYISGSTRVTLRVARCAAAPANGRVADLVALITSAAKIIESHYSQSSIPNVPSLDDLTPHPLDSAISPPELREAVQTLEGACAQLSATVARPSHTILNACLSFFLHSQVDAQPKIAYESDCLNVVLTFKIPDILQDRPTGMHVMEIGKRAGVDHAKIGRILRLLASKHIFREVDLDCFANNRLSFQLLSSSPLSNIVGHLTDEDIMTASAKLASYLADPEWGASQAPERSPWNKITGYQGPLFKYFEGATPQAAKKGIRFGIGMQGYNEATQATTVLTEFPWENFPPGTTVCDVGGGVGNIAMELLKAYPNLQLKLQDLPDRIHQAETQVWPAKYPTAISEKRIEFKAMDFLVDSPIKSCDVYYLKHILHNWPDKECIRILQGIRAVLKPSGRSDVRLDDFVLQHANRREDSASVEAPEPLLPNFGLGRIRQYNIDVGVMMVTLNSRERTLREVVDMANEAGLEFIKLWDVGELAVVEFKSF